MKGRYPMVATTEVESVPMFGLTDAGPRIADPIPLGLPRRRKRTAEALQAIDMGRHPVVGLPLHPEAPEDASRKDRYPRPFTCGSCLHLGRHVYYGVTDDESVTKPVHSVVFCEIATYERPTRKWWPGCVQWKPIPEVSDEIHG